MAKKKMQYGPTAKAKNTPRRLTVDGEVIGLGGPIIVRKEGEPPVIIPEATPEQYEKCKLMTTLVVDSERAKREQEAFDRLMAQMEDIEAEELIAAMDEGATDDGGENA